MPDGHGDLAKSDLLTAEEREQSVVITDPSLADNPIIYVSDEFVRQTGYTPAEAIGRNCKFLQGPGTDPADVEAIREALRSKTPITIDILNYRKDGSEFWNRLRIRPLYNEQGVASYFAGAQNPIDPGDVRRGPSDEIRD